MCGLTGMAGNVFGKDLQAFKELLIVNALRGSHSTGVAVVQRDWTITGVKGVGSPFSLGYSEEFHKAMRVANRVFIGHGRHATVGNIIDENAHPFEFENLVGAHNGTLSGRSNGKLTDRDQYGTDSEALYANISAFGVENVIPEMEGAWALVWFDRESHRLNFLRNKERPLSYCFSDNGQMLFWASEPEALKWILSRNGIKVHNSGFLTLKEDTWVSWDVPINGQRFGEPRVKKLEGFKWKYEPSGQGVGFFRTQKEEKVSPEAEAAALTARRAEVQRELDEVFGGTAPSFLGARPSGPASPITPQSKSPPGQNEPGSSGRNSSEKQPRKPAAKHVGKDEAHPEAASIKRAYEIGKASGKQGRSKSANPFSPVSDQGKAWLEGRLHGLEHVSGVGMANTPQFNKRVPLVGVEPRRIVGYQGELLTLEEWKKRTDGGCCQWCGDPQNFGDLLHWNSKNNFFCDPCVNQEQTQLEIFRAIGI